MAEILGRVGLTVSADLARKMVTVRVLIDGEAVSVAEGVMVTAAMGAVR